MRHDADPRRTHRAGAGPPGPKARPGPEPRAPAEPLAAALAAILAQARAAAAALSAELGPGALDDRNHYDYLAANLAKIAGFQSFSLAEYAYHLPDGRNPGVRLWLEERRWQRRVEVLLFPEVGRWQVDAAGRKVNRLLLTLWPQGDAPAPSPALAWKAIIPLEKLGPLPWSGPCACPSFRCSKII